jgi:hypothetical protein
MIRLEATDPAVSERTLDALVASQAAEPALRIRCAKPQCRALLAYAGTTSLGPLFASWWDVDLPLGRDYVVNGERLSRRAALRHEAETRPLVTQSGRPITDTDRHGAIALLALPPEMVQDYPDLMVRCITHGDTVLDRTLVLDLLHAGQRDLEVALDGTWLDYDHDALGGQPDHEAVRASHSTETRRVGQSTPDNS